ncbi:MAG: hypothetical protein CMF50_07335 [Legionellales bacterium]|nr:hypothetical protein [Legionellales bacterium]|tara:strand:+ start:66843 stop:67127 length:285 start_codon:yes stop_codon:yes gene_type:complete
MSDPKKPTSQAELMGGHLGTFHRQPEERKHAPAEQAPVDAFQASNIAGMWAVGEVAEKLPRNVGSTGPIYEASNGKVVDLDTKAPRAPGPRPAR